MPTPGTEPGGALERRRLNRLQAFSEVVIATAIVLAVCYLAKLPLVVLLVSILLAFILAPLVELLQRARLPRGVGAAIAVALMLGVLVGITLVSYNRAQAFMLEWPRYRGEIRGIITHIERKAESIQRVAGEVMPEAPPNSPSTVRVQQTESWTEWLSRTVAPITELIFAASFIPFLAYFMLTWQEHVRANSVMLFRMENRNTAYVTLGLISSMIRSFIIGNVLVGLFISGISTAVFGLLGLPYFYFLGVISGFLSLIPYLGVLLAIIPPVIVALGRTSSGGYVAIVATVIFLHLFALNVLYPKFLGSRLQLNPLAVTLALLFWGWLWGAMGLILAIPITAALKIILDHVESLRPYGRWLGD